MNNILRRRLLRICSALMLICALPMLLWCMNLINTAALDYDYAGLGCLIAAMVYAFSIATAIVGLIFSGQSNRYTWCRILAYIQMTAGVVLIFLLRTYAILTLPPLFIFTSLYLSFTGWRNKPKQRL